MWEISQIVLLAKQIGARCAQEHMASIPGRKPGLLHPRCVGCARRDSALHHIPRSPHLKWTYVGVAPARQFIPVPPLLCQRDKAEQGSSFSSWKSPAHLPPVPELSLSHGDPACGTSLAQLSPVSPTSMSGDNPLSPGVGGVACLCYSCCSSSCSFQQGRNCGNSVCSFCESSGMG